MYCVRGNRASAASVKYYNSFCAITRRLVAPVVIVVTHLERERNMEDWWNRNLSRLEELKMEFDGYACITACAGHPRLAESKRTLVDLITRNRCWGAKDSGYYFGSLVQKSTPSAPLRKGISRLFKPKDSGGVGNGGLDGRPSINPGPSSTTSSPRNSSYHTAQSQSVPPSPIVEPPTPCSAATPARVPHIDTDLLIVSDPLQSSSEETSSMRSSLHPTLHTRYAIMMHFKFPDLGST